MPNWFWVLVLIAGVLAVGLLRERWRMREMESFAAQRGFVLHSPFVPGELPPMAALAAQLEGRPARRWGAGLSGAVDSIEFTIAEHEMPGHTISTPDVWHVMLAWRPPDTAAGGEWATRRQPGNLTKANVEALLAHLPKAQ